MRVKDLRVSPPIREYRQFIGEEGVRELEELADKLRGIKLQEINSARSGGGVAEVLNSYVPFINRLGLDDVWSVIDADTPFFKVTKTLHNFLQRGDGFAPSIDNVYWNTMRKNKDLIDKDRDVVTVHDPQPVGLVDFLTRDELDKQKLIWRCHVHLKIFSPEKITQIGEVMEHIVEKYHASIFSTFEFLPLWRVPSFIIPPFIDPLSEKNRELTQHEIEDTKEKYGLDAEKPLITQVSRFDVFKDPIGVIAAFKLVHQKIPCQLLLVGGGARDDPEYQRVLGDTRNAAGGNPDIHILDLPPDSHREINAFQRASEVIVQKSVKEGFGLTVAEGLWKGKPVVGGKVGGITLQIKDGWNGFLVSTVEETAEKILYLLKHPKEAAAMGENGKKFVAKNFLLTRGVKDHLTAIDQLLNGRIVSKQTIISYHPWY
jgi:trehalose synthase